MERNKNGAAGCVEELEQRTRQYLASAKDQYFVDYLQKMLERIQGQQNQVKLLNEELDRSYQMYLNRMKAAGINVQTEEVQTEEVQVEEPQVEEAQVEEPQVEEVQTDDGQAEAEQAKEYRKAVPVEVKSPKRNDAEFVIGTILLSVIGGAFILTALVMLGMYFMNGFVKGMCLYAVSLVALLVSELVLYRKIPKLGMTITAIAIGGLYLSTVLNYLVFGNFNMWVALGVALATTVMVIVLSWKRDSILYRSIGLITCYLCALIMQEGNTFQELVVLAVIIFFVNIMCMVAPVSRYKTGFRILHMYINGIYTYLVNVQSNEFYDVGNVSLLFAGCAILVTQLLYVIQIRYGQKEEAAGRKVAKKGIVASYFVSGMLIYLSVPDTVIQVSDGASAWVSYGSLGVIFVISIVAILLIRKGREMWYPYFLWNIIALHMFCIHGETWECIIAIVVSLVISKLLSLLKQPLLQFSDAVLTTLCCIMCLNYVNNEQAAYGAVLLAGVLLSIPFIRFWQAYYEIIIVYTLAIFSALKLPPMLKLPAFVGIMFVGILLFNNVKRWRGKYIEIFNGLALAGQITCFLMLMNPVYRNAYIIYFCMLIFGLATIVLTFQKKYHMNFKNKNLILAVFLTYMALVLRTSVPIINSILMMLIALICVGLGFSIKQKAVRIYGVVLSLMVCGKIVLYDFFYAATLQKTILFFTVGVIALAISGIYIVLERKTTIQRTNNGEEQ